ncbi:hypothetical protein [Sphingomonas radiodurans]|uniref:hypothetical protein n=1 Tax=Sphingomonas radiodurans TaxID=2890321 RepID=UPI001E4CCBCD|nr:hypothetical protein [Sphingomonas radiodurans]WBH17351.1 hypothetical protein LLW23_04375 [Sphingomonas radiodurans]
MTTTGTDPNKPFLRTLVEDVIVAFDGLSETDTQAARRNVIRTSFAAIEGLVWQTREQVRSISLEMGYLTPLADMALREQNYTVSEQGEVIEQVRYVTITASIRLTIKQVQVIAPQLMVDFSGTDWEDLRNALRARHRITHPKSVADLLVSEADIALMRGSFMWLFGVLTDALAVSIAALASHVTDVREIVDRLNAGDPVALRVYRHALENLRDE